MGLASAVAARSVVVIFVVVVDSFPGSRSSSSSSSRLRRRRRRARTEGRPRPPRHGESNHQVAREQRRPLCDAPRRGQGACQRCGGLGPQAGRQGQRREGRAEVAGVKGRRSGAEAFSVGGSLCTPAAAAKASPAPPPRHGAQHASGPAQKPPGVERRLRRERRVDPVRQERQNRGVRRLGVAEERRVGLAGARRDGEAESSAAGEQDAEARRGRQGDERVSKVVAGGCCGESRRIRRRGG